MNGIRIATLAALLACGGVAGAQPTSGADMLQSLSRCRAVAAADARLDCFDKATAALESAVQSKSVTILDQKDIRDARRSLFGFTLPRLGLFGAGQDRGSDEAKREDFDELNTTIASIRPIANGRIELRLADQDAVWVTTDPMPFPPRAGAKIRIRKGAVGNYFLAIAGQRSVRGVRLR